MSASFGERIRQLRKERGWTQGDLAKRAKIDHTYLSKIENDKESGSEKTIRRIAELFGADVEELIILARRIPIATQEAMTATPSGRLFLRNARDLSEADWQTLVKEMELIRSRGVSRQSR